MSWLWKAKALLYDKTIRRVAPLHRLVRMLAWRLSRTILILGGAITKFEVPLEPEVAPYFRIGLITGGYEREIIRLYSALIRPGMTVVDVGANVGYHTIRFATLVGPEGRVFAFEPFPSNFDMLLRNIRRRGLANVVAEKMAISDSRGSVTLYRGSNDLSLSIVPVGGRCFEVESVSLDDYFDVDEKGVHFVKIDVEGAELRVLRGMQSLMERSSNLMLIVEFYPRLLSLNGQDTPMELLSLLSNNGFHLYEIRRNGDLIPLESYGSFQQFIFSISKLTNLFASRRQWQELKLFT